MRKDKDISVIINCSEDKEELIKLEEIKTRIVLKILSERYGEKILEQYINSIKRKGENHK